MPSYDFQCRDCGDEFETRMSISSYEAGEGRKCPKCGSAQVERAFTTVNVIAGGRSSGSSSGYGGSCGSGGFT